MTARPNVSVTNVVAWLSALALVAGLVALAGGEAQAQLDNVERVDVADFVGAGVAVSQRAHRAGASAAVLATAANFPDALSSSALAAEVGGPILFTNTDALPEATAAELDRLLDTGDIVYLMGGEVAISGQVEAAVQARGYQTERVAGPTRLETAAQTAQRVGLPADSTVLIARAFGGPAGSHDDRVRGWVDAVSCGGYAADTGTPVLLTETERLSNTTAAALDQLQPDRAVICGGPGAVSEAVAIEITARGVAVERVSGPTRVETAVDTAKKLWGRETAAGGNYILVNGYGENYGFGLASAVLSAAEDAPILLVDVNEPTDCDDQAQPSRETLCYLATAGNAAADVIVVGGDAVVSDAVADAAGTAAGGTRATPSPTGTATATATATATPSGAPAAPTDVRAADAGNDDGSRVRVTWAKVTAPGVTGYNVYYGTGDAEPSTRAGAAPTVGANATEYVVTGLKKDTEYRFAVTALRGTGESAKSAVVRATPLDEVPGSVKNFRAQPGDTRAILSWDANVEPDVTKYIVQRQDLGAATTCDPTQTQYGNPKTVSGRTTTTFTDTGLTNGQNYCYRIVAVDAGDKSSSGVIAGPVRPAAGLPSVQLVYPEGGETFRWSGPQDIQWTVADTDTPLNQLDVKIVYSPDGGLTYPVTIYDGKHPSTAPEGKVTWRILEPQADQRTSQSPAPGRSRIRITVFDPTNQFERTSQPFNMERAPSKVTGVTALGGDNQVALSWTAVPETATTGYKVYRAERTVTAQTNDASVCNDPALSYVEQEELRQAGRTSTTVVDKEPVNRGANGEDFRYCYRIQAFRRVTEGTPPTTTDHNGTQSDTVSANPDVTNPSVGLVAPTSGETLREGRAYTVKYKVEVPPGAPAASHVHLFYCVDYTSGNPPLSQPDCRDADDWKRINTSPLPATGGEHTHSWTVPSTGQGTTSTGANVTGAVEARIYSNADAPLTSPANRDTKDGILYR